MNSETTKKRKRDGGGEEGSGGGAVVATVKFNVGGKHFEVSRALIDEHSDTMLGGWCRTPGMMTQRKKYSSTEMVTSFPMCWTIFAMGGE